MMMPLTKSKNMLLSELDVLSSLGFTLHGVGFLQVH